MENMFMNVNKKMLKLAKIWWILCANLHSKKKISFV